MDLMNCKEEVVEANPWGSRGRRRRRRKEENEQDGDEGDENELPIFWLLLWMADGWTG